MQANRPEKQVAEQSVNQVLAQSEGQIQCSEQGPDGLAQGSTGHAALWEGDAGGLARDTRRALVRLLQGPYVSSELHPDLWNAVVSDEPSVRRYLADLFLTLVMDRDVGVAFVRNVEDPSGQAPSVVRSLPLTLVDTVLLLHLRTLVLRGETSGQRAFVDRSELQDHLAVYRPHASTDHAGFAKRVNASINKMKDASILRTTQVPDRFQISPVLNLIFGPDEVAAITAEYRRMLGEDTGEADAAASTDSADRHGRRNGSNGDDGSDDAAASAENKAKR
ncbi:DUF4194 domain-containing protein [Actinomyces oris]|jgi:hypothetical protein|uniref:DUF4194 domain-containing protein n=1 Tax=Actinomyces oris TaxID=544580 RepID=UPI0009D683BC|nr:DUF4194 domain-containing protein [Actinomyces oris]